MEMFPVATQDRHDEPDSGNSQKVQILLPSTPAQSRRMAARCSWPPPGRTGLAALGMDFLIRWLQPRGTCRNAQSQWRRLCSP